MNRGGGWAVGGRRRGGKFGRRGRRAAACGAPAASPVADSDAPARAAVAARATHHITVGPVAPLRPILR